ncbi:MAG: sigma-70 family RNA polymerase sigma factor [Cellvibrio sp.]|uniref:sigma-70 family RNA polymerase sigma factor n=1 Tax=Cellvibrio sp. TaxID=1965322 RepID=UPI00319FC898
MQFPSPACPTETLYRDHNSWLRNWLRVKLGCSQQAADLAQDTFLRILGKRDYLNTMPLQEPRAFLRVIAGGLLIDHFRRRSLEQAYLDALASMPESFSISPEEQEILLQTLHRIDAALDQLSAPVRKVFLLAQIHGLTYTAIAQQMAISERTVKRYMQQGFGQCIAAMF